MTRLVKSLFKLLLPFRGKVIALSLVSFLSSGVLTGFYLLHKQQKSFSDRLFKNSPKFDYELKVKEGEEVGKKFNYADFMDWIPLYSEIDLNDSNGSQPDYFYNLIFNGLTPDYQSEISKLELFKKLSKKSLTQLFSVFDLSDQFYWKNHFDQAVTDLTTVHMNTSHDILYYPQPKTLVRAWSEFKPKMPTETDYFNEERPISLAQKNRSLIQSNWPGYNQDLLEFFQYSLIPWISSSVSNIFGGIIKNYAMKSKTITALNHTLHNHRFPFILNATTKDDQATNKELLYEFIFGKATTNFKVSNDQYRRNPFALQKNSKTTLISSSRFLPYNHDYDPRAQTGLRGMTGPITTNGDFFAKNDPLFSNFLLTWNTHFTRTCSLPRFERHLDLITHATGWELRTREEGILKDFTRKKTHRLVLISDRKNYSPPPLIISGRLPLLENEIMISPQYARQNQIQLGSWAYFDVSLFHIVGIATDPLSFLPNSGFSGSIFPDTKNQSVVYLRTKKQDRERSLSWCFLSFLTHNRASHFIDSADADYFLACFGFNPGRLNQMIKFLSDPDQAAHKVPPANQESSSLPLIPFSESPLRFNWLVFKYVNRSFNIIALVGLAVLTLLLFLVTIIISSNLIKNNKNAIGLLRAIGFKPTRIAWRYSWWAFFLLPGPIILGWLVGIFLPGFLNLIFASIFSSAPRFTISFWPLLVGMGVILGVALLTSWLVFVKFLQDSPVKVMRHDFRVQISPRLLAWQAKFQKLRIFKSINPNTNIRSRFHISSIRHLLIFGTSIFVSTTVLGLVLIIPSSVSKLKKFYFSNLNYRNEFSYYPPPSNSPLGKYNLNFWSGPQVWNRFQNKNAIYYGSTQKKYGLSGFPNVADYSVMSGSTRIFPFLLFNHQTSYLQKSPYQWGYQRYFDSRGNLKSELLLSDISNLFFANQGRSISIATLDFLMAELFHAPKSEFPTIAQRLSAVQKMYNFLNSPDLRLLIESALGHSHSKAKGYRKFLLDKIIRNLPFFIANYINNSPARYFHFYLSWKNILSLVDQDVLTIKLPVQIKHHWFQLLGLNTASASQKYVKTESTSNDRSLQLSSDLITDIHSLLTKIMRQNFIDPNHQPWKQYKTIKKGDQIIYDAPTHQLYLPVLINKLTQTRLHIKSRAIVSNLLPALRMISFQTKNQQYRPILKQFWVYDDSDFGRFATQQHLTHFSDYRSTRYLSKSEYLLNPFELSNTSFSYIPSFAATDQLSPRLLAHAPTFFDYYTDQNQHDQVFIRPLFNFANIDLYLPAKLINLHRYQHPDSYGRSDASKFIQMVDFNEVPSSVTTGFKKSNWSQWVRIQPFSPWYDRRFRAHDLDGISLFKKKINLWSFAAFYQKKNPLLVLQQTRKVTSQKPFLGLKIALRVQDTIIGGHDGDNIYVHPALALLIGNYNLARTHVLNVRNLYGSDPPIKIPGTDQKIKLLSEHPESLFNTPNSQNKFWFSSRDPVNPYLWSNHKFSSAQEPLDLTTGASYIYDPMVGVNNMLNDFDVIQDNKFQVQDFELTSQKEQFVDRLVRIGTILAAIMIIVVVFNCFLATYFISEIFLSSYYKFMTMLKMDGYSTSNLMQITVPIFIPYLLLGWGSSMAIISILIKIGTYIMAHYFSLYLPFLASWWLFLATFLLVSTIFLIAVLIIPRRFSRNTIKLARAEGILG